MTYVIEEFCLCGGWTNNWKEGDNPIIFNTKEEAEIELDDFFIQCHEDFVDGIMEDEPSREDFRIKELP